MSDHAEYAHTVQGSGTPTEYGLTCAWAKLTGASEADAAKEVERFIAEVRADEREKHCWWIVLSDEEGFGPFESLELAMNVRQYVEIVHAPQTYAIIKGLPAAARGDDSDPWLNPTPKDVHHDK